MKKSHLFILCTYCVILFFSCEDKDQINGAIIEPPQDEYIDSNLNPGGENFGHVGALYLNLASDEVAPTYEFWKFNSDHLAGNITHYGPDYPVGQQDKLTLTTYNDSYYVPPEAFNPPCRLFDICIIPCDSLTEEECIGGDWSNYCDYECSDEGDNGECNSGECVLFPGCSVDDAELIPGVHYLDNDDDDVYQAEGTLHFMDEESCSLKVGLWDPTYEAIVYIYDEETGGYDSYTEYEILSDLTTETTEDSMIVDVNSTFALKTPPLSTDDPLEDMIWSIGENMYSFSTMDQLKDTLVIEYAYDYKLKENFVPLDTLLNPIVDDAIIIMDPSERSEDIREYDVYDVLEVSGEEDLPILIGREHTFYSYKNELNHHFGQRESTDCNDNYQKDAAELKTADFIDDCVGECSLVSGAVDNQDECESTGLCDGVPWFYYDCGTDLDENGDPICPGGDGDNPDDPLQGNGQWDEGEAFTDNIADTNNFTYLISEGICSAVIGGVWEYAVWTPFSWVNDPDDSCNSYCDGNPTQTMYDLCWNSALDDVRLTAHCVEDSNLGAFCDYGNNLLDGIEILYDACEGDCDGENGDIDVIGQGVEPFEDRNCNGTYDKTLEETLDVENEDACLSLYGSWKNYPVPETCFLDSGNGEWDDIETCYGDLESCSYMGLYKKGIAPNYLLVSYADQDNPAPLTTVLAGDVYKDCGTDLECNEEEDDFNPGDCVDGYSGTEELCCKHNLCWNYDNGQCDFEEDGCSEIWQENLDPEGDDCTNCSVSGENDEANGEERNFQYDEGESILKDFNADGEYSSATQIVIKLLNYEDCISESTLDDIDLPLSNCGGNTFDVISDNFEVAVASSEFQKEESKVEVESNSIIGQLPLTVNQLNELNIVKTSWPNSDELDGYSEDYMLFRDSDNQDEGVGMHYIIKMIQPYYYYANTYDSPNFENLPDEWWQAIEWEQDTLIYSLNGSIIDGQSFYSSYSVESDTANYVIHKEYEVSTANANMVHSPTVENCILITRTITTTMLGPAIDFKIKSETYLKNDGGVDNYPIVKEDVYWSWPPVFESDRIFVKTSSIEFHQKYTSSNGFFNNSEPINLDEFQNNEDFDFEPFKLSNTMGLQRMIVPE